MELVGQNFRTTASTSQALRWGGAWCQNRLLCRAPITLQKLSQAPCNSLMLECFLATSALETPSKPPGIQVLIQCFCLLTYCFCKLFMGVGGWIIMISEIDKECLENTVTSCRLHAEVLTWPDNNGVALLCRALVTQMLTSQACFKKPSPKTPDRFSRLFTRHLGDYFPFIRAWLLEISDMI